MESMNNRSVWERGYINILFRKKLKKICWNKMYNGYYKKVLLKKLKYDNKICTGNDRFVKGIFKEK